MAPEPAPRRTSSLLDSPLLRGGIAAAVIVVVAAVLLVVRAGRGSGSDGGITTGPTPDATDYGATIYTLCGNDVAETAVSGGGPPVVGQPPPDFALCDADGSFVTTLSGMKGKVVWLNFWATWCVPCKKELPDIQKLYDEKNAEGLEVLIINYKESQGKALEFLPQLDISLPLVIDRPGEIYGRYRLTGLPDSFFIGRDGNLATLYYGFVNEEIARERLTQAGLP
ncbi:MAG: TlpA family protein disulfide reductase [Chloroflexi bacterium]|nr:TlpA family protein disulfide reductase [Chloroflexota bacterium]